ncbi:hypothetical protein KUCAC02_014375 [Chaenocephalus aceratus]|uniref:Uncharacterized protein n=1 Tax=Chaenocephalus aceratus TaxID=36190 RepID=A0ACB9WF45_CHAAC|nr:hypothetical protein KUCAC02_014375 [Chaenocephalus aceratus]
MRDSPATGGRSWVQTAGPSASSAVLQAVTAERPYRYGRPCLGGDCGCKLRGAGLAMYRALLHRDSLFFKCVWRLCLWALQFASTGSGGGRQVPT